MNHELEAAFNDWLDKVIDTPYGQFDRGEFFLFSTACHRRKLGISWLRSAFLAGVSAASLKGGDQDG